MNAPLWSPALALAFLVSFAGIAFVLWSRNVPAKRIVLPLALVLFSGVWLEMFHRSTLANNNVLAGVTVALLLNAIWVTRIVRYCAQCGRTFQHSATGNKTLCPGCGEPLKGTRGRA